MNFSKQFFCPNFMDGRKYDVSSLTDILKLADDEGAELTIYYDGKTFSFRIGDVYYSNNACALEVSDNGQN